MNTLQKQLIEKGFISEERGKRIIKEQEADELRKDKEREKRLNEALDKDEKNIIIKDKLFSNEDEEVIL